MSSNPKRQNCSLTTKFQARMNQVYKPEDSIIIAWSGGVDSSVLIHLAKELTNDIYLIHINDSHSQYSFERWNKLQKWLDIHNLSCRYHLSPRPMISLTEQRDFKYSVLAMYQRPKTVILTGHNFNDQIENIFLKSMRGSNPSGWLIPFKRLLGASYILRPLIDVTKEEIYKFAKENKISYVDNPFNEDLRYSRNYLRNHIISPLIKHIPQAIGGWKNSLKLLEENNGILDSYFLHLKDIHLIEGRLSINSWQLLNESTRRWFLTKWIYQTKLHLKPLSHFRIEHIDYCLINLKRWHYQLNSHASIEKRNNIAEVLFDSGKSQFQD